MANPGTRQHATPVTATVDAGLIIALLFVQAAVVLAGAAQRGTAVGLAWDALLFTVISGVLHAVVRVRARWRRPGRR